MTKATTIAKTVAPEIKDPRNEFISGFTHQHKPSVSSPGLYPNVSTVNERMIRDTNFDNKVFNNVNII